MRLLVLSLIAGPAMLVAQDGPDAAGIFQLVQMRYSTCKTFSCEGTSRQSSSVPLLGNSSRSFQIQYSRPDKIRIEWRKARFMQLGSDAACIYTDDGKIFSLSDTLGGPKRYPSISQAIGVEAGVSGGISFLVPSLLLGEPGYLAYWSMRRGPDSVVDGQECFSVALETKGFGIYTLDISKKASAILRATQDSEAAVLNAQRERAHKENPAWFNDPLGPQKTFLSSGTVTDFKNVVFDVPIGSVSFKLAKLGTEGAR